MQRSLLHGFVFWFFSFWFFSFWFFSFWFFFLIYILIFFWSGLYLDRTRGILGGFPFDSVCILNDSGERLVLNLIYTRMFFRTLIARIKRILQVRGTCFIKDYCLISIGEADNSSFFILHSSFFIVSAAASGHACKSVWDPFESEKAKVK